jgi:hypothetical protein
MPSMRALTLASLLVVGSFLGGACGDDDAGDDDAPTIDASTIDVKQPDPVDAGCTPQPDATPSGKTEGDLSGTWAVNERVIALVGQPLNSSQLSRQLYVFDVTQEGENLTIAEHMCDIQVDDVNDLETTRTLPKLWEDLPVNPRTGTVVANKDGTFTFTLTKKFRVRGAALTDVENDPLPTMASDPRLRDMDSDSQPGITLLLDGILRGRAFVVQREFNQYTTTSVGADRLEGRSVWSSEQVYIGSDPPEIAELNAQAAPDPDPTKHNVFLVRIPDGSDCAYLVANQCSLFDGK